MMLTRRALFAAVAAPFARLFKEVPVAGAQPTVESLGLPFIESYDPDTFSYVLTDGRKVSIFAISETAVHGDIINLPFYTKNAVDDDPRYSQNITGGSLGNIAFVFATRESYRMKQRTIGP